MRRLLLNVVIFLGLLIQLAWGYLMIQAAKSPTSDDDAILLIGFP